MAQVTMGVVVLAKPATPHTNVATALSLWPVFLRDKTKSLAQIQNMLVRFLVIYPYKPVCWKMKYGSITDAVLQKLVFLR
jgi:hypothetical protein